MLVEVHVEDRAVDGGEVEEGTVEFLGVEEAGEEVVWEEGFGDVQKFLSAEVSVTGPGFVVFGGEGRVVLT